MATLGNKKESRKPKLGKITFDTAGFADSVNSWANGERDTATKDRLLRSLNDFGSHLDYSTQNAFKSILQKTKTKEEEAEEKRLAAQPNTYAQRLKDSQMREMYYNDQIKKYDAELASGKHLESSAEYADILNKKNQLSSMAKAEKGKSDAYAKFSGKNVSFDEIVSKITSEAELTPEQKKNFDSRAKNKDIFNSYIYDSIENKVAENIKEDYQNLFNVVLDDEFNGSYTDAYNSLKNSNAKSAFGKQYKDAILYEAYSKLKDNSDFNELSKGMSGVDDDFYKAINNQSGTLNELRMRNYRNTVSGGGLDESGDILTAVQFMTPEEKKLYTYIYNKSGKEEADKYYKSITQSINQRNSDRVRRINEQFAEDNPIISSAVSVPLNLAGGIVGTVDLAGQYINKAFTGEDIDINSKGQLASQSVNTVRGTVADNIDSDIGKFAYNTGMSIADNALRAAIGGGLGLGANAASIASGALMSVEILPSSIANAKAKGYSDEKALLMGVIDAAIEGVTEKYSLEAVLKGATQGGFKGLLKARIKAGIAEGSEEGASDILNLLADGIINGKNSDFNNSIKQYIANGDDTKEAIRKASLDFVAQMGEDVLSGAISGVVIGTFVNVLNQKKYASNGESLKKGYAEDTSRVNNILSTALQSSDSRIVDMAQRAQQAILDGGIESVNNRTLGELQAEAYKTEIKQIAEEAKQEYIEKGASAEEADIVGEYVEKLMSGEEITKAETEKFVGVKSKFAEPESVSMRKAAENAALNYERRTAVLPQYASTAEGRLRRQKAIIDTQTARVQEMARNGESIADNIDDVIIEGAGLSRDQILNVYENELKSIEAKAEAKASKTADVTADAKFVQIKPAMTSLTKAVVISPSTNNASKIEGIAVKNNGLYLKLSSGEVVKSTDAVFNSKVASGVIKTAEGLGQNGAVALINAVNNKNMPYKTLVDGFKAYYEAGLTGDEFSAADTVSSDMFLKEMGETVAMQAYQAGVKDAAASLSEAEAEANAEYDIKPGLVNDEVSERYFNGKNRLKGFVNSLAEKLHVEVRIEDGISGNGYYENGVIHISAQSDKLITAIFAHEVTHYFEQIAPKEWRKYRNDVVNWFKENHRTEYEKTIKRMRANYSLGLSDNLASGTITEEQYEASSDFYKHNEAYFNELAAQASEVFFNDEAAMKEYMSEHKSIAAKFKEVIDHILDAIAELMGKYEPTSEIGKALSEQDKYYKGLRDSFMAMLEAASDRNVSENTRKNNTDDGVRMSYSSIGFSFFGDENINVEDFESGRYKSSQGYIDYVNNSTEIYVKTHDGVESNEARKIIEDSIDGIVRVAVASKKAGYDILDDAMQRDTKDSKGRLLFSSLEPNSDYFTSNDISAECDKRKNFAEIYDAIVTKETELGVPVGKRFFDNVDNYFFIHKILADKGLTYPCEQCYVESMRKNLMPMANAFLRLVMETNPENKSNDQLYQQKGKNKGQLKTNNAKLRERVLETLGEYEMSADELTIDTLTTADGLARLKIQAPLIYEAFNSFYGQSKPKMPRRATPFRFGELIALLTDDNGNIRSGAVNKINSTGGFRLQSYSDFQIQNYVDVLQVIFEAGVIGLNGHAYTKVPAFLEATNGTNLKRNVSIFMYKDGDEWKLDKANSFSAVKIEDIYDIVNADKTGNTSIIAVSQNEDMSAYIMANDNIGFGIPFHKSGNKMGTVRVAIVKDGGREILGYAGTKDHTKQQTEVYAKATADHKAFTKVKNGINIYEFWDFDNAYNLTKKELIRKNVSEYFDRCEENGYLPKFREYVINNSKVLNNTLAYAKSLGFVSDTATIDDISFKWESDSGVEYTVPYGYYKFLGDFGMFTPDGKASPHKTLSLENYDFSKAEKFFADSEKLRRNEILQQFVNGEERERYRNSDLTAQQLADIVEQKRQEVANEVVYGNAIKGDFSDVEYLELAKDPEKNEARLHEMVSEAQYNKSISALNKNMGKISSLSNEELDKTVQVLGWVNSLAIKGHRRLSETEQSKNNKIYRLKNNYLLDLTKEFLKRGKDVSRNGDVVYFRLDNGIQVSFHNGSNIFNENNEIVKLLKYSPTEWDGIKNSFAYNDAEEYEQKVGEYKKANRVIDAEIKRINTKLYEYLSKYNRIAKYKPGKISGRSTYTMGIDPYQNYYYTDQIYRKVFDSNGNHDNIINDIINKALYNNGLYGFRYDSSNYRVVEKNPKIYKSADLVTYDDEGNIIPLSERFRTDRTGDEAWKNDDIRFDLADYAEREGLSEEELDDSFADFDEYGFYEQNDNGEWEYEGALDVENILRGDTEYESMRGQLEELIKQSGKRDIDRKAVRKLAEAYVERYNSTYSANTLTKMLNSMFALAADGKINSKAKYKEFIDTMASVLGGVIQSSKYNNKVDGIDAAVQNYLKGQTFTISRGTLKDLEHIYDGWRGVFGALNGKFKLAEQNSLNRNITSVDIAAQELEEIYPGIMNGAINEADQALRMIELANPTTDNDIDEGEAAIQAEMDAYKFFADYFSATAPSSLVKDYKRKIIDLKAKAKAKTEKNKEKIKEVKKTANINKQKALNRQKESQTRDKILKLKPQMEKLSVQPKGYEFPKNVSDAYGAVIDEMSRLKHMTKSKQEFANTEKLGKLIGSLKSEYQRLSSGDTAYANAVNNDVIEALDNVRYAIDNSNTAADFDYIQMEELNKALRMMKTSLSNATSIIQKGERISIYKIAENVMGQMNEIANKKRKGIISDKFELANFEMLNPLRLAQYMDGYNKDGEITRLVYGLNDGQHKANNITMQASKITEELRASDKADAFTHTVFDSGLKDKASGKPIKLTHDMAVQIVMHWYDMQGRNHMRNGGITIPNAELLAKGDIKKAFEDTNTSTAMFVSQSQINAIEEKLTEYDKEWMAKARETFDYCGDQLNETTEETMGVKKATNPNYVPIATDRNFTKAQIEAITHDASIDSKSIVKDRVVKASNPIMISGISQVLDRHIKQISDYCGYKVPMDNFQKVLNTSAVGYYGSVKEAIGKAWGNRGKGFIDQLLTDVVTTRENNSSAFLNKLTSNFVQAALVANASVTIKQAASYTTAGSILSSKALGYGLTHSVNYEDIDKHTAIHWIRRKGLSQQELAMLKENPNKLTKALDKLGKANPQKWIQAVDCLTTGKLWNACVYEISNNGKSYSSDAAKYKAITELYERVIEETQPNYDALHRPEFQKSTNSIKRALFMFKTQPMQNFGIMANAFNDMVKNNSKETRAAFGKAVASQAVSNLVFVTMSLIARTIINHRPKKYEDEEGNISLNSVMSGMGQEYLSVAFSTYFPVIGDIVTKLIDGENFTVPQIDMLTDVFKAYSKFSKDIIGNESLNKLTDDGIRAFTNTLIMVGVPANTIKGYIDSAIGYANDIKHGKWFYKEDSEYGAINYDKAKNANEILDKMLSAARVDQREKYPNADEVFIEKEARGDVKSDLTSYYKADYINAVSSGDKATAKAIKRKLDASGLYSDDEISKWVIGYANDQYKLGNINEKKASALMASSGMTDNDIYWKLKATKYNASHTDEFNKWSDLDNALNRGNAMRSIQDYIDHGVELGETTSEGILQHIGKWYKDQYFDLSETDQKKLQNKTMSILKSVGDKYNLPKVRAGAYKTVHRWSMAKDK